MSITPIGSSSGQGGGEPPQQRAKSKKSVQTWTAMHDYLDSVDEVEKSDAKLKELEDEIALLKMQREFVRKGRDYHHQQATSLLDMIKRMNKVLIIKRTDAVCVQRLRNDGFRGIIDVPDDKSSDDAAAELRRLGLLFNRVKM